MPNLFPKQKYAIHLKHLKFALKHGFKLTKVHKILKFKQCAWLKKYIDFNTNKRREASINNNKFGVMLHKLANNIIYGKSVENVRNRTKGKLLTTEEKAKKAISQPKFKRCITIRPDLVIVD